MSGYKRAEQPGEQADPYVRLLCTEPGCGRRWTVQLDKPQCSFHAWGQVGEPYASMASSVNSEDANLDGKRWARRIIKASEAGERVRPVSLKLAQQALRILPRGLAAHTNQGATA